MAFSSYFRHVPECNEFFALEAQTHETKISKPRFRCLYGGLFGEFDAARPTLCRRVEFVAYRTVFGSHNFCHWKWFGYVCICCCSSSSGFFLVAFVFVLACSGYFISNVWEKWSASPVIITLSSKVTPISDFPFPAVTICNMNQAKESDVVKFTNPADEELLQNLCRRQEEFNMSNPFKTGGKWPRFRKYLMDVKWSNGTWTIALKIPTLLFFSGITAVRWDADVMQIRHRIL